MFPIYLTRRILQEFLSSIDHLDRSFDLFVSIVRFTLVCKQWRLSVVPQLSFETPTHSALGDQPNHRIKGLLSIGFRNFNVTSSDIGFKRLRKADRQEEKRSKGEEKMQMKRLDQLKAFRDNTTIISIDIKNTVFNQEEINDYIDPRRLKVLNFFELALSAKAFKVAEYLSKNSFPEIRNLVIHNIGTVDVNWSFPTMPQLESIDISDLVVSGDELDIIFSRVRVIKIAGAHNIQPLILSHLERSTVVRDFTMTKCSGHQVEYIFHQLARLLNSNNTLKSLNIQLGLGDLGLQNPLPLIHNTTLESLTFICFTIQSPSDPFTTFFSNWTGSNLKTLVTQHRMYFKFTSEYAHQIQSTFPKLENISFHVGDIKAFESYILSNHNLKTIIFGADINSSVIGCLHSIRDLIFHNLSVDNLIQILSMQSPALKSLKIMNHLSSPSFLESIESLAHSIRDNQHLTNLSFKAPLSGFLNHTQFIKFLTSIIEGNRSLLSLVIGYSMSETDPLDPIQFSLFKQSIISNCTIQTLKIPPISLLGPNFDPSLPSLHDFLKSQSIQTI